MRQKTFLSLLISLFLLLGFAIPHSYATSKAEKEKELKSLRHKINKITRAIDVKLDSKSQYIKQLKHIETSIGEVSRKILETNQRIQRRQADINSLQKQRKLHQQQLSKENELLASQVFAAYTLGKQERMKLLFSQQNVDAFQRNLVYYQYFSNARVKLIEDVQFNISKILETEASIGKARQMLEQQRSALASQQSKLKDDSRKRKAIVSSLDDQLKKQGGHLNRLKEEEAGLQELLKSIEEIFNDIPAPENVQKPFAKLKGNLAWPVKGSLRKLFGRQKPLSNLRWQGVLIEAPEGRHVKAIAGGRVAFADWLRGMGNLIIIDHGNSYLSLYGQNESLFKSAGEWVQAGDIISSVGNSGGQKKSGLYFEIRKKGKPQNPTRWCKLGKHFASL